MLRSACLFLCLFAYLLTYLKNHPNFTKFCIRVTCGLWPQSYSDSCAECYVFPVLWMTSCFHIMEWMGQNQRRHVSSSSLSGGVTRGDVCRLQLHFYPLESEGICLLLLLYYHLQKLTITKIKMIPTTKVLVIIYLEVAKYAYVVECEPRFTCWHKIVYTNSEQCYFCLVYRDRCELLVCCLL